MRKRIFLFFAVLIAVIPLFFFYSRSNSSRGTSHNPWEDKQFDSQTPPHPLRGRINGLSGGMYYADRGKWSPPLNQTPWIQADSASEMESDDPIGGLYFGKHAWAIPMWVIKNHHVANVEIEGRPLLITFCDRCSSMSIFDPIVNKKRYTFHIVGMYNGTHVISDYETDTVWGSFTGEALSGKLKGTKMQRLRLVQCLWKEWLELHPSSMVIDAPAKLRLRHTHHFPGERQGPKDPFLQMLVRPIDKRLPSYELVLGVSVGDQSKAYAILDKAVQVFNDSIDGEEIVIIHKPGTIIASAFSRKVGNEILYFEEVKDGSIIDRNHGSRWNVDGEAISGPMAKKSLSFVHSGVEEWYAWAAYHAETELVRLESSPLLPVSQSARE